MDYILPATSMPDHGNPKRREHKHLKNYSTSKYIISGLPQGSVLGPILFLVYINKITDSTPTSDVYLFADATTLFVKESDYARLEKKANKRKINFNYLLPQVKLN